MASFTGGTVYTPPARIDATTYQPLMPGGGGEAVDPKRFLNVSGTATPIQ